MADGEITVTYRLWSVAKVSAGKRYRTGFGTVEVEDVRVVPAALIPEDDVAPSGLESVDAIRRLAGDHKRVDVAPDTLLYRVQFRFLGDEE